MCRQRPRLVPGVPWGSVHTGFVTSPENPFRPKCDGQVLLTQVWKRLNLIECDYFGLEFQNAQSCWIWLEPMKPIVRQVRRPKNTVLRLAVKFFPPDPGQLQEEYTRVVEVTEQPPDHAWVRTWILRVVEVTEQPPDHAWVRTWILRVVEVTEQPPDHAWVRTWILRVVEVTEQPPDHAWVRTWILRVVEVTEQPPDHAWVRTWILRVVEVTEQPPDHAWVRTWILRVVDPLLRRSLPTASVSQSHRLGREDT
ncbi:hypothetical protein J1605_010958 [Eschrichtius robustus]|uniref:FERM N-terminal domain-containing protein n=1 Tax=Eschrichtius robustus TaxID=9764 RepID=A0AB34GSQ8_ESCRO|nr:hypothetical protein J1605_010958 [Eschrichtius robustus]